MGEMTRERDLVLAPNEFAFISDQTKGNINVYVGPYKTSLANTDQPVSFSERVKRFERCLLEQSIQVFPTAPEGWYLVMKNPARDSGHPKTGTVSSLTELDVGRKVNIAGPVSYALWPGQMVRVVQGHHLRSNQYLLVRVYDEEAAKRNWATAVIKPQSAGAEPEPPGLVDAPDLTMGKLLVIKGTEVAFYIPPTGVEVVRDGDGSYVREAVTLERLEYCILRDEDGNKRFIQGPRVVFPRPTETFVERDGRRHFRAIELNEMTGIYVKVIAPYEEGGREYRVGEELFITGKETMIYFPRPEHAAIKYGDQPIHYAVAIPAGEGRYCLDRNTGNVSLVRGPCMFLPDPRTQVIVRRVLDERQCALWFPGNKEILAYNGKLALSAAARRDGEVPAHDAVASESQTKASQRAGGQKSIQPYAGDDFSRKTGFTPPRTITLDTKYEGAVTISVWTGYAVLVLSRRGDRRVVVGPTSIQLEYDETLEAMDLSTGKPKSDEGTLRTAYLRVLHNKVSDIVVAETRDLVRVSLSVSYRVNFEGDPARWFDVENYVKFLCDHMRSLLRNAIKHVGIEAFHAGAIDLVRNSVLGAPGDDGKRVGRMFPENGMRIYDVEVLDVTIGDDTIESLLTKAQHHAVARTVEVASARANLEYERQGEEISRELLREKARTRAEELALRADTIRAEHLVNLAEAKAEADAREAELSARLREQESVSSIHAAELTRRQKDTEHEMQSAERALGQRIRELESDVSAVVAKASAVSPDLVAALQGFSDRALVERMAQSMAPLAILGGGSVADVMSKLLKGTSLEKLLPLPKQESGD